MGRNQELASAAVADLGSRFKQDILKRFFARTHMSLILDGTLLMLLLGVQSMAIRYPLAVLACSRRTDPSDRTLDTNTAARPQRIYIAQKNPP
jgi:hypothetical protein